MSRTSSPRLSEPPPCTVAVVAFDGISPFHLSVPCLVFGQEMTAPGLPRFRLLVCASETGPLRTTAGFAVHGARSLAGLARADILIVPSWHSPHDPAWRAPPAPLLRALRAAHARGALVVGLCLGAFVLAEAGLLEGRPATTHWALATTFAQRYPGIDVRPDVLYVDDGQVLTSAGTAAGIDCCLHLLRREYGAQAANQMARRMVVAPHRQGGQAQFVAQPLPESGADHRLAGVLAWVQQHLHQPHTLDALAARALLSRRSFTRHFRQVTGTTVGRWLLNQRLSLAQRQLEATSRSIEQIAQDAGFGSATSLRQHFAAALRTSPSAYRRAFRAA